MKLMMGCWKSFTKHENLDCWKDGMVGPKYLSKMIALLRKYVSNDFQSMIEFVGYSSESKPKCSKELSKWSFRLN